MVPDLKLLSPFRPAENHWSARLVVVLIFSLLWLTALIVRSTGTGGQMDLDASWQMSLGQMLEQPPAANGLRGTILNMASALVRSPDPHHFNTHAYTASKAAIAGLSLAMAAYYAPHKIRVNAIAPSLVRTALTRRAQGDELLLEYVRSRQPLSDGMIEPDEVAQASVFLLSDESRNITGELITVDGGWCVSG